MNNRDYYSPGEIIFTKQQILWLLQHIGGIRDGFWPSSHKETGYAGGKNKPVSHSASFEGAAQIAAELDRRIEATGDDGLWLEMVYTMPEDYFWPIQHIANAMRLEKRDVEKRIKSALNYCIGKCPRWLDCPGAGMCVSCKTCPKLKDKRTGEIKCRKKPRIAKTYEKWRQHK